VADQAYEVARLDEIEREPSRNVWVPIRRRLGISAFGVNAWASSEEGADIIPEHEESSIGHEELYVVVDGAATFTVDGQEIDGPAGTVLFVRDPAVKRAARTKGGGATILTVGAKPGEAFRVSPWERNAEVLPLFERGDYEGAKAMLEQLVADEPDAAGPVYNLACAEAQLGEHDAALRHLARSVEIWPAFAEVAREDDDLAPIRDDPRFP
jgi:tetratricopeptide (TPR) repeat protein